ncbi:MAG TPA: DUF2971 domain-containing protein [Prolixibacteraceae bacterium]|nr:DUF2971 domain-containing protein [Prolixibacteraceae bacterium]
MEPDGFVIDGWEYSFDPSQPMNKTLKVVPEDKRDTPEFLYKYYNLSHLNIDAIKNNYLYAASRFELNDDFDCLEQLIDMKDISNERLITFYSQWHTVAEIVQDIEKYRETFALHKATNYYGGFGVISLSENIHSQTMWAHYANSNHGFAVKFNLNNFHENMYGPFPVNYKTDWSPIKLSDVNERLAFLYMTNIKSVHWDYEKEWRYIGMGRRMSFPPFRVDPELVDARKFNYSMNAIEEIILGPRFINGLVRKDVKNNRILLEPNSIEKYGIVKQELLEFITENNMRTSRTVLKEGSKTFELDTNPIEINRIDENLFEVRL